MRVTHYEVEDNNGEHYKGICGVEFTFQTNEHAIVGLHDDFKNSIASSPYYKDRYVMCKECEELRPIYLLNEK